MGTKSKFFRVFVEGNTISDGREITAEMIDQIVETFNAETYTPRINVEHIAGFSPEPPFNGYGDVIAVRAQDDQITIDGQQVTRRALYAQVDANSQLVQLARDEQKPFPSVELTDSYAGTGKAGLIGLAFTDKPASIATQRLQFSRSAPGTVFAAGAEPATLEFDVAVADSTGIADAIISGLSRFFNRTDRESQRETTPPRPAHTPANDNLDLAAFSAALGREVAGQITSAVKPANDAVTALTGRFDVLEQKLGDTIDNSFGRPIAANAAAGHLTDC